MYYYLFLFLDLVYGRCLINLRVCMSLNRALSCGVCGACEPSNHGQKDAKLDLSDFFVSTAGKFRTPQTKALVTALVARRAARRGTPSAKAGGAEKFCGEADPKKQKRGADERPTGIQGTGTGDMGAP